MYLPQASIFVAETQRHVVGGAVLALRPSVRAGGFVGTIDLLVVDPDHDVDRVADALIEEVVRSASNKGCTLVEVARPDDQASLGRWAALGFTPGRSAHPTNRGRGGNHLASHLIIGPPSSENAPAGRQHTSSKE